MTASPVDVAVNPNNKQQRYVLWGNGRIDNYGGAPAVSGQPTWFDRLDQPVAVALHVTNWTTGAGYMLDYQGGFQPFGGAPALGSSSDPQIVPGVPYVNARNYVDWAWHPDGNGQGYVLSQYGQLHHFGGATPAPRAGDRWRQPFGKKLQMNWGADGVLRAITLDAYGGLHPDFGATVGKLSVYWAHQDNARDFVVTDWSNGSGHVLDLFGGVHEFGTAPDTFGWPYNRGGDVARALVVLSTASPQKFWQVWSGGQQFEYVSSTPPTVLAGGGTSEIQRVTISGAPTGGSFTLSFGGQTTAAISFDATAATVDSALEALSSIGAGNVSVTGGPGPGTPWTVAFTGALATTDVAQMTATSSLTGGTTPSVAVATTRGGVNSSPRQSTTTTTRPTLAWTYTDPQQDAQKTWQVLVFTQAFVDTHNMGDPFVWRSDALVVLTGTGATTRGAVAAYDFPNGTYRMYVAVEDVAGQWSPWSNYGWAQNVAAPATPTGLTASPNQGAFTVALSVSATTGGSANLIRFDCSDDGGKTWLPVRGADAVTLAATTTATDYDAPLGVARTYRAVAYALDPRVASAPSATASATLNTLTYVVTAVDDSTLGGRLNVQEPVEWTRPVAAGIFQGIGAQYPVVVSDGRPKGKRATLHVFTGSVGEWSVLERLALSDSVLLYRDPFGSVRYCKLAGDWAASLMPGAATRHLHTTDLPLVEVAPPHLRGA